MLAIAAKRMLASSADDQHGAHGCHRGLHHKHLNRTEFPPSQGLQPPHPKEPVHQGEPRNTQPADQPLTTGLKRCASRLLAQLKQLPRLASEISCKPKHVVQSPRPVTAAPVDTFSVTDPQERFELRECVFEKIRRILGVVFGSYRRSWPGYSLGSHFCAFLPRRLHELG